MPTRLTIPERQQFGVGAFESFNAFHGFAALRWSWPTAFSPVWPRIDEALGGLTGIPPGGIAVPDLLGGGIITLTGQQALANITKGLTHTQHAAASQYVQRAFVLDGIGTAIERVAADVLDTKKDAARRAKPKTILRFVRPNVKAQLAPLAKRTAAAEARATAAEHRSAVLEKRVASLERRVHHAEGVAIPGIEDALGGIKDGIRGIKDRIGKLGKWATLGAFLLLLAKALEKAGLNYIRCRSNKRWGSHLCQNGDNFLSDLIAATSLFVGTLSLVEFTKMMQPVVGTIAHASEDFWQVK